MASRQLQPLDPCTESQSRTMSGPDEKQLKAQLRNRTNSFDTDPVFGFSRKLWIRFKKLKKNTLEDIFIDIFAKLCNFNTRIRIRIRSTDPYPEQATQIKTDNYGPASDPQP